MQYRPPASASTPLLGSGGNAGKRDFSDGWSRAVQAIGQAPEMAQDICELRCLLLGQPVGKMIEKLNAACWFSDANKLYNSPTGRPYREGAISPWAMALACEGLMFFCRQFIAATWLAGPSGWRISIRYPSGRSTRSW